jgi:hypothetical protein
MREVRRRGRGEAIPLARRRAVGRPGFLRSRAAQNRVVSTSKGHRSAPRQTAPYARHVSTTDDEDSGETTIEIQVDEQVQIAAGVRLTIRSYFSWHLLWTAIREAELAERMEAIHEGQSRFSVEHRGHVLSSIVASAGFLEAMINEVFQDAAEGYGVTDGYLAALSPRTVRLMTDLWRTTNEGARLRTLEKYELLVAFADAPPLDRGAEPYQDASLVVRLRNVIAHYQPEDLSAEDSHQMQQALQGKFDDNALMAGSGNSWWTDHALGHGCAEWAHRSAKALTDKVADDIGIRPNYRQAEANGWFGETPDSIS